MAQKQLFGAIPLRTMRMDLSGLEFRALVCVASHDRMSGLRNSGQGCSASNDRMRQMVGCNYTALCKALTRLVERGLIERQKHGRHTRYRVIYNETDMLLFSNPSVFLSDCKTATRLPE